MNTNNAEKVFRQGAMQLTLDRLIESITAQVLSLVDEDDETERQVIAWDIQEHLAALASEVEEAMNGR